MFCVPSLLEASARHQSDSPEFRGRPPSRDIDPSLLFRSLAQFLESWPEFVEIVREHEGMSLEDLAVPELRDSIGFLNDEGRKLLLASIAIGLALQIDSADLPALTAQLMPERMA